MLFWIAICSLSLFPFRNIVVTLVEFSLYFEDPRKQVRTISLYLLMRENTVKLVTGGNHRKLSGLTIAMLPIDISSHSATLISVGAFLF